MSILKSGSYLVWRFDSEVDTHNYPYIHTYIHTHTCSDQEKVWQTVVRIDSIRPFIRYLIEEKEEEKKAKEKGRKE